MIKHCNKIWPDCSCYFMPCNILLFASTVQVCQKNQTWMGQCERGWGCAGRIFHWQQQHGWEGYCQKINLIQGQSPVRNLPLAFQGEQFQVLCRDWRIHWWISVRFVLPEAQIQIQPFHKWKQLVLWTGSLVGNGPCHNGILVSL